MQQPSEEAPRWTGTHSKQGQSVASGPQVGRSPPDGAPTAGVAGDLMGGEGCSRNGPRAVRGGSLVVVAALSAIDKDKLGQNAEYTFSVIGDGISNSLL